MKAEPLKEGVDYYLDDQGLFVFTAHYHLKRGSCCGNGCKHCPYTGDQKRLKPDVQNRGDGE